RARRRRSALLLPTPRRDARRARRPAALCRADRLPLPPAGRTWRAGGPLRLRVIGAPDLSGGGGAGLARLRAHSRGRHGDTGAGAQPWSRVGGLGGGSRSITP